MYLLMSVPSKDKGGSLIGGRASGCTMESPKSTLYKMQMYVTMYRGPNLNRIEGNRRRRKLRKM